MRYETNSFSIYYKIIHFKSGAPKMIQTKGSGNWLAEKYSKEIEMYIYNIILYKGYVPLGPIYHNFYPPSEELKIGGGGVSN